jgi:glycosyltransferase family protein
MNNINISFLLIKLLININLFIFLNKIFIFLTKYKYCSQCIEKLAKLNLNCSLCPNKIVFKNLKIVSTEKTLNEIIKYKKSISRLGDGEYHIIFGQNITFERYNNILSKRLSEVLNSNEKNLLVGLFFPYKKKQLDLYRDSVVKYWREWLYKNKYRLLNILNKNKKYYSSDITRFYTNFKDKSGVPKYIKKFKKIWEKRNILIVEGEKSRLGIGNDLFNNAKSIKRIICPNKYAFKVYDKILNSVKKVDKGNLILIALGPTATILAYDLSKLGYQAIDIGHADIQYELYLRNASTFIQIPKKYVNEFNFGRNEDVGNITDIIYYKQIIDNISF